MFGTTLFATECRNVDSTRQTIKEIEALLASRAADYEQLAGGGDGVDLGCHHDVFRAVLKQVNLYSDQLN